MEDPMQQAITLQDHEPAQENFLEAVIAGLSDDSKSLPCKFFYDEAGSRLFERICDLEEYYLTRTELAMLVANRERMADLIGPEAELIEFGCGSLVKIRILLGALDRPTAFIPIDISRQHLINSAGELAQDFPDLEILPVCADYTQPVDLPVPARACAKKVGFFPGSTIGNFDPDAAVDFLKVIAGEVGPGGDLIIGVDTKKDQAVLNAAYNDAQGITAAFNLNILRRINRELDGNIDLSAFRHHAGYNQAEGRVEMHLITRREQALRINGHVFRLRAGEAIHTENSYKYTVDEFTALAARAGFTAREVWLDAEGLFSIHYLTHVG